jgi:hypothetical protein
MTAILRALALRYAEKLHHQVSEYHRGECRDLSSGAALVLFERLESPGSVLELGQVVGKNHQVLQLQRS